MNIKSKPLRGSLGFALGYYITALIDIRKLILAGLVTPFLASSLLYAERLPSDQMTEFVNESQAKIAFNSVRPLAPNLKKHVNTLILSADKPLGSLDDYKDIILVKIKDVRKWNSEYVEMLLRMPNLKFLEINGELSDFPEDLNKLKNLPNLILLRISLKWPHRFPEEVLEITQLRCLDLSDNMILGIAADLPMRLPNLRELYISGNDLKLFSLRAGGLTQLECLDLSDNSLLGFSTDSTLPTGLSVLDISHNRLECFQNVLKQCTNLEKLKLEYNYLSSVPSDWLKVVKVKKISISSYTKIDDETKHLRDDITWTIFDERDAMGCK